MEKNLIIEVKDRDGKFIVIKKGGKRAYFVSKYHSEAINHAQDLCEKWDAKLSDLSAPPKGPCCNWDYDKDGNCPRHPEQNVFKKSFIIGSKVPDNMKVEIDAEELLVPVFHPDLNSDILIQLPPSRTDTFKVPFYDSFTMPESFVIPAKPKQSFMQKFKEVWEDVKIWCGGGAPPHH